MTDPTEVLAAALNSASHYPDPANEHVRKLAAAILAAMPDHVLVPRAEYERLQRIETAARGLDLRPDRAITDSNAIAALRDALSDSP